MDLSTLRYLLQLNQERFIDSDTISKMQSKLLEKVIESARTTSYYGKILQDIPKNDFALEDFPVIGKDDVRRDQSRFIKKGYSKKDLIEVKTSGSTGQPTKFYLDKPAYSYREALRFFLTLEAGRSPFDVFTWFRSHGFPPVPKFYSNLGLYNCLVLYMTTDEKKNLEHARKYKSTIFGGYPSSLQALAHANNQLKDPIKLKYAFSGAELLSSAARKFITDSFSCPVFNAYACWEFGPIAFECLEEHNLHLNSGACHLEVLDKNGKPKKSGTGDIVISGLQNTAMPLLRYRLGDRGILGGTCSCGRSHQVIKSLEGRSDDWIVLPSGRVRPAFSMNVGIQKEVISGTWSHQLVQEKPDLFVFRYVPIRNGISYDSKSELQHIIQTACLGEQVSVEFEEVDSIPPGGGGKIQRIISKVKPPNQF